MNINIYLEDELGKQLNWYAKHMGKSRNTLVREAVREWVVHHENQEWPNSILSFRGVAKITPFESTRDELLPPKEDPLA